MEKRAGAGQSGMTGSLITYCLKRYRGSKAFRLFPIGGNSPRRRTINLKRMRYPPELNAGIFSLPFGIPLTNVRGDTKVAKWDRLKRIE